ncbi:hypothetical protein [Aeoliella mucimassa]|uniref:Glycosyltransferase RgtA/B/C/D-like domain-containing protein n=1 Tax=Aeoliella mucimassa TaxID=2527972 RepID=A0A518AW79_9BACT|nr:hypothetical protein [Aeoliella mucimassa]QDU58995.1 hypothetical protein Pan181_52360 [Aeoliella mucimassa]
MFRSRITIAILLACATLAISALVSYLRPPLPRVHDEFSYLLAGDTYAHGRMTNPTHPMWRHFETMHVIHQPSYASKYPPGQGLALAVGQRFFGWPIVGVWISSVLAVLACYWMLLGMTPPKWAAVGAACLILHPGFEIIWGQSFWGGSVAFIGGALVLGAAARMLRPAATLRVADATAMAVGTLVLANTRPFEGALYCLLVGVWMVVHWTRHGWPTLPALSTRVLLPQLLILGAGFLVMTAHNRAVTGSSLTMPYQVHERTYALCPVFLFEAPITGKHYLHDAIRKFHEEWSMKWYNDQWTLHGLLMTKWRFFYWSTDVLLPYVVLVPVLMLPWWRGSKWRWPLALLIAVWALTQATVWNWPHYIAPVAPVVYLLVVDGLRNLRVATRRFAWSRSSIALLIGFQALLCGTAIATWVNESTADWHWYRNAMQQHLEDEPGKHLVLVEYSPEHHPHAEWVWNEADIDAAKVVWAHSMSDEENAELIDYFQDRHVWHVAADLPQPPLAPYKAPSEPKPHDP